MSEQKPHRPQPLTEVTELTAIALQDRGQTRLGVAIPGSLPQSADIYLAPGYTDKKDLDSIYAYAATFISAVLGVLNLNEFECSDETDVRADFVVTIQALAVEALDVRLKHQGQNTTQPEQYYSQVGGSDSRTALHLIHHEKRQQQWRKRVRALVAKAGGMSDIEIRENQTQAHLVASRAVSLPGVALTPDSNAGNFLIRDAFASNVHPRLLVAKANYDQVMRDIIQGAVDRQPTRETVYQAAQVPTKKQW